MSSPKRISVFWLICLILSPVAIWAASSGYNANVILTAAPGDVNLSGSVAGQGTSLAMARADHTHSITGTVSTTNGGTGLSSASDDAVLVGDGAVWQAQSLPSCTGSTAALRYSQTTNTWTCNTSISAATLSSDPTDCSAGQYATSIGATGNLSCAQVNFTDLGGTASDAQIPDTITVNYSSGAAVADDVSCSGCVSNTELASTYSGVGSCSAGQFVSALNGDSAPTCSTPTSGGNIGGEESSYAAGNDERFLSPLTGFETSTFPPSSQTQGGVTISWVTPSPTWGTDTAYVRSTDPLTGHGATTEDAHRGDGYMVNGNRGVNSSNSSIRASVALERQGYISFWYRAGTETCCDYGRIYLDSVLVLTLNVTDTGWTKYTSSLLAAGSHTVDFRFSKDGSVHSNGDKLMIDDFTVMEGPDLPVKSAVTGTSTVTGSGDLFVDITTISSNYTVTLGAAKDGQRVYVVDRTGTAGTGSYIVKIAANGSETFRIPNVGSCSALYVSSNSAAFTLLGVSGVGWEVVGGTGYAVDPRSITGLFLWLDARRGVTLTSQRLISSWADFSGNSNTVTQATAAQQPVISRLPGSSSLPAVYTNGAQCLNSGNVSLSSGALSAVALLATAAPGTDSVFRAIFGWNYGATTGAAFALSAGSAAFDWQTYDSFLLANGYDGGRNPRAVGYWGTVSGAIPSARGTGPHVLAARVGASSAVIQGDGVDLISRTSAAAAVPNITNQPITVLAEASARANPYLGWLGSLMVFTTDLSAANLSLLQADLLRQAWSP